MRKTLKGKLPRFALRSSALQMSKGSQGGPTAIGRRACQKVNPRWRTRIVSLTLVRRRQTVHTWSTPTKPPTETLSSGNLPTGSPNRAAHGRRDPVGKLLEALPCGQSTASACLWGLITQSSLPGSVDLFVVQRETPVSENLVSPQRAPTSAGWPKDTQSWAQSAYQRGRTQIYGYLNLVSACVKVRLDDSPKKALVSVSEDHPAPRGPAGRWPWRDSTRPILHTPFLLAWQGHLPLFRPAGPKTRLFGTTAPF